MGVLLQGFFKLPPNRAVPAPTDGDPSIPWWWDHLAAQAHAIRKAGFSAVWLPPVLKTSAGVHPGSDGYGPFDDYDIGSKDQMGSRPTRFGSREALQRCVATLRANGLDAYVDMVEHHRSGDRGDFVFRYKGADGTPNAGRFPKDPPNFLPNVPRDPNLGGQPRDDFPFGRELAPINARPQGYVFKGLVDAADWLTRALDIQGYRIDDVKGLSTDFVRPFLDSKSMAGKFAVGEFFDGNVTLVNQWVSNPHGMRSRASAFDFPLRFILQAMCNNPGRFNMADLDHAGLAGTAPLSAVTFVENHDTDLKSPVIANKILGYAYILTSEGYPCVYYRDYSTDPDCYGLRPLIDNLVWIHEHLAAGPTQQRWKDFNLFAYERLGGPGLLVGLNNDPGAARTVEVATGFGAAVVLHDYTGHGPDVVTTGAGTAVISIPANVTGHGYVCYSRAGIGGDFAITPRAVTQVMEGDGDLDLPPAANGVMVEAGRVWCEAGTAIQLVLEMPGLTDAAEVTVEINAPDGSSLARQAFPATAAVSATLKATVGKAGPHRLSISLANAPGEARPRYRLAATYTASPHLSMETVASQVVASADEPKLAGQWDPVFRLPNAAIHTHLLPSGKVLFWGRRDQPTDSLDVHSCTPHIWDPATRTTEPTPRPTLADGATTVNLFCSGHSFLADGRLLVAGGHIADGNGLDQATIYDWRTNAWTALPVMNNGRWYPTVTTLHDGTALVLSGSFDDAGGNRQTNEVQQIWDGATWRPLVNFHGMPLYPRVHAAPDGQVFMPGPLMQSYELDPHGTGAWAPLAGPGGVRGAGQRDYAPSVMYGPGRVIYIGGGNDIGSNAPTAEAETIDLASAPPTWRPTGGMHQRRRQHNATLLPDGTVLVTGGTRGGGGANKGFNDLTPGQPVHEAELWDPATGQWTMLASEAVDRCYHATAILLPDATVLSAGGGEYRPNTTPAENPPQDTHRDAQIFHPPYLFRGPRPELTGAPTETQYGATLMVDTPHPEAIAQVSWIRLSSVTHSFNTDQRINFLEFRAGAGGLAVTAPSSPDLCLPGYYMLFLLDAAKVPSIGRIIRIAAGATQVFATRVTAAVRPAMQMSTAELDRAVTQQAAGTHAVLGLTSTCPYGLAACWGGAYEALRTLAGVHLVRPVANAQDSTADVYLHGEMVPDIERWVAQMAETAKGSYDLRGVEISIAGALVREDGGLAVTGPLFDRPLPLRPLDGTSKVQWNRAMGQPWPALPSELAAFDRLIARAEVSGGAALTRVTGPLTREAGRWTLHVRSFEG